MVDHQPPGFRFYPTEEELVSFYLHNKLTGQRQDLNLLMDRIIPVINIYDYHPSELPQFSLLLCHRDPEQWFFFIPRQESEARGGRPNRLTSAGYWKATGSPGLVYSSNNRPVGEKRTMVFYSGRAPNGRKTDWKMNEYKAIDAGASTSSSGGATSPVVRVRQHVRQEFSLCRVYKKTKSLRSFDRRPPPGPGAVIIGESSREARQRADDHHEENINIQRAASERTSSPDSSSSGDDGSQPPQVGGSSNRATTTAVTSNNEAWWDWEWDQLDDLMF